MRVLMHSYHVLTQYTLNVHKHKRTTRGTLNMYVVSKPKIMTFSMPCIKAFQIPRRKHLVNHDILLTDKNLLLSVKHWLLCKCTHSNSSSAILFESCCWLSACKQNLVIIIMYNLSYLWGIKLTTTIITFTVSLNYQGSVRWVHF